MLVILLTIPILDTTLELNIYQVHNLPAIPPGHQLAVTYQLEGNISQWVNTDCMLHCPTMTQ